MEFLFYLLVLLLTAKVFGEIAERMMYPSILGYLVAGIFLGPLASIVFGYPIVPIDEKGIAIFGELGAILLLFVAGLGGLGIGGLFENKIASFGSSFLGYLLPFIGVLYIASNAYVIDPKISFSFAQILFLVTAVSVSSIIPSVKVLIHFGKLNTLGGRIILANGIFNAGFGLIIFTFIVSYVSYPFVFGLPRAVGILSIIIAFLLIFLVAERIIPTIISKTVFLEVEEAKFTTAFVVILILAYLAQIFGFHGIIGAFLAGIIISKSPMKSIGFSEKIASLSYGIFIPIFFAWMGLQYSPPYMLFPIFLIGIVLTTSLLGSFFGVILGNLDQKTALVTGLGMVPRGGIDLVILAAGKSLGVLEGIMGDLIISSVILVIIFSIVLTPLMMKLGLEE